MYVSTADCTTLQSIHITHDGKEGETNNRTLVIILQGLFVYLPVQWQAPSCTLAAPVPFATQDTEIEELVSVYNVTHNTGSLCRTAEAQIHNLTCSFLHWAIPQHTRAMQVGLFIMQHHRVSKYLLALLDSFKLLRSLLPQINIAVPLLLKVTSSVDTALVSTIENRSLF